MKITTYLRAFGGACGGEMQADALLGCAWGQLDIDVVELNQKIERRERQAMKFYAKAISIIDAAEREKQALIERNIELLDTLEQAQARVAELEKDSAYEELLDEKQKLQREFDELSNTHLHLIDESERIAMQRDDYKGQVEQFLERRRHVRASFADLRQTIESALREFQP